MGRGKKRRKYKQKQKRLERVKKGELVKFDLQNSGKKYLGFKNKYCYKTNIHKLIYKNAKFQNVRYQASNLTNCNYKMASFVNVDFCNCNLKNSKFKDSYFENVIFINCNLRGADFTDARFKNVFFIMTNIDVAIGIDKDMINIKNKYPQNIQLYNNCEIALYRLGEIDDIYKYHVFHIKPNKINMWIISILIERYGKDLGRALNALEKRNNKKLFYTMGSYINFIDSYLKI